jgi:colanic acid biosynthesis glycosyl transferase WcaI
VKITYLSQYFPPEMGAPAARASELARHWVGAGHDVTVLTGFPNHPTGKIPLEYRSKLRRLVTSEEFEGAKVVRSWLLPFPNRKPYERMLNYSSFCLSAASTGMFLKCPDVLIASSPQLLVALSGWWLARWKKTKFVFEVRDLWPESLAAVGMGDTNSPLHRSLARIAGFLYRQADRIVVVTPAFEEYLVDRWKVPREKISVVENGVETELFSPQNSEQLRHELNAHGRFIVSYIGTMGMAQGLDTLIESAARLQHVAPEVLLLLIGEGADKERIQKLAGTRRLTNIRFVDQQPRTRIPAFISASDASLVLLKKTDLFRTVIPTKMLEFMSCACPLILGVDGQARDIMEQARAGVFIEPENPEELVSAVIRLAKGRALREELGKNGRRYILQNFSRERKAFHYIEILQTMMNERGLRNTAVA